MRLALMCLFCILQYVKHSNKFRIKFNLLYVFAIIFYIYLILLIMGSAVQKIFVSTLIFISLQSKQGLEKSRKSVMDALYQSLFEAARRNRQAKTNSFFLVVVSTVFHSICVLLILPPTDVKVANLFQISVQKIFTIGRNYLYFPFDSNPNSATFYFLALLLITAYEISYLYLLLKPKMIDADKLLLSAFSYSKGIVSLPFIGLLLGTPVKAENTFSIDIGWLGYLMLSISILAQYLMGELKFTCLFKVSGPNKIYNNLQEKTKIVIKLILIFVIIKKQLTIYELIICNSIIALNYLILIFRELVYLSMVETQFLVIQYIHWIFVFTYFSVRLMSSVEIVCNNWEVLFLTFGIWATLAFRSVLSFRINSILITSIQTISSETEAIQHIRLLYQVYSNIFESGNSLLFLGLMQCHKNECKNLLCLCKQRVNNKFRSKQQLLIEDDFGIKFIQTTITMLKQRFEGFALYLQYLTFQVQIMKKYPMYFYEKNSFYSSGNIQQLSLVQRYSLKQIYNSAVTQIELKYKQKTSDEKYTCSFILQLQEKIEGIYQRLEKLASNFYFLYKMNSRKFCSSQILKTELQLILEEREKLKDIFDNYVLSKKPFSIHINMLTIFFYRAIFSEAHQVRQMLRKTQFIMKILDNKDFTFENFNVKLFNENGCVLQSTIQKNVLGIITKVSASAPRVFGYPSIQSMSNIDANLLLPRCLRVQHQRMIRKWTQTGSFKNIDILIPAFSLTYDQLLLKIAMRTQIIVVNDIFYVIIGLTKIDEQTHLMVDQSGRIDSFGKQFKRIVGKQKKNTLAEDLFSQWKAISSQITRDPRILNIQMQEKSQFNCFEQNLSEQPRKVISVKMWRFHFGEKSYIALKKVDQITNSNMKNENKHLRSKEFLNDDSFNKFPKSKKKLYSQINEDEKSALLFTRAGTSSSTNNQNLFSIWRIIEQLSKRSNSIQNISYPHLYIVSILLAVTFILSLCVSSLQIFVEIKGNESFNEIIYADAAVSDNMQLLEQIYNNVLMYDQLNCWEKPSWNCQQLEVSTSRLQNILTQLLALDIEDMVKNETFYQNKYFLYQFEEVNITHIDGTTQALGTYQFMEYFIMSSKLMLNQKGLSNFNQTYIKIARDLNKNWQQMKRINHANIKLYQLIGIQEINKTTWIVLVFTIAFCILSTLFVLLFFYMFSIEQKSCNEALSLFRYIPIKVSNSLAAYYEDAKTKIKSRNYFELSQIQQFLLSEQFPVIKLEQKRYKNRRPLVFLFFFWCILLGLSIGSYLMISSYNQISKNTIIIINQLMQSENYMLQGYFQIKKIAISQPLTQRIIEKFIESLRINLNIDQNQFVLTSMNTITSLGQQQQKLNEQFANLVIEDICEATKTMINFSDYQKCKNTMNYKIMEEGILIGMIFFQNLIIDSASKLKSGKSFSSFNERIFSDLDRYIYYFFKMYQATQAQMIQGLSRVMKNRIMIASFVISTSVLLKLTLFIWWLATFKVRLKAKSNHFGFLLCLPFSIMKDSKFIQQKIRKMF